MSIKIHKVYRITDDITYPSNDLFINCLSWFTNNVIEVNIDGIDIDINCYQVSPYYLKNEKKQIFENIYQAKKIYEKVYSQNQMYKDKIIWKHPEEIHLKDGCLTEEYFNWRKKLENCKEPVRRPNSYDGARECIGSVALPKNFNINDIKEDMELNVLQYIDSRKEFYVKEYAILVVKTQAFKNLKLLIEKGYNLHFNEIDIVKKKGGMDITQENFDKYIKGLNIC